MASKRIYLDDNASAPTRLSALEAARTALGLGGNPSSIHAEGRAARRMVNSAREAVGALAGVPASAVIFTSGASEANAMALAPDLCLAGQQVTHLLVSAVEHPSVRAGGGFDPDSIIVMPVDRDGVLSGESVANALDSLPEGSLALVSVMAANNETGVVQPINAIAQAVHDRGCVLHCDGVQAAGRLDLADATAGADLISLSGHKMGAPSGIGALIVRNDAVTLGKALIGGGGQERNRRAGTENLSGIAGFGAAAEEAGKESEVWAQISRLREWIEGHLRTISPGVHILGADQKRLPNTICVALDGVQAETAVIGFDLAGIAISSGSACSSGKVGPSHVLEAMGVEDGLKRAALRISLTRETTREEANEFLAVWRDICAPAGQRRSAA